MARTRTPWLGLATLVTNLTVLLRGAAAGSDTLYAGIYADSACIVAGEEGCDGQASASLQVLQLRADRLSPQKVPGGPPLVQLSSQLTPYSLGLEGILSGDSAAMGSVWQERGNSNQLVIGELATVPLPRRLFFLHICKCGTSFVNTLFHQPGLCPALPASAIAVGEKPLHDFYEAFPDMEVSCQGMFYKGVTMGYHRGLGTELYGQVKGRIVTFLRDPVQRLISSYFHQQHDWPFPSPARDIREYAEVVQGCQVRFFVRAGYWSENSTNVCGGPQPVQNWETTEAVRRLREDVLFFGITDRWNLSICLFHTMFGGSCKSSDFPDTRKGSHRQSTRDLYEIPAELRDFVDQADGELFAAAQSLFDERLERYGVTEDTCRWCFSPGSVEVQSSAAIPTSPGQGELAVAAAHDRGEPHFCSEGKQLPKLYLLGAQKSGTTTLAGALTASGLAAALWEGSPNNKEFHFFDCYHTPCPKDQNGYRWAGSREMWLQSLPPCGQSAHALADYTPRNLRLVPLPPGSVADWPSQGLDLPRTLVKYYSRSMRDELTFVVLLREPLRRFQSGFYHAKSANFVEAWSAIQGQSFEDSLRRNLAAARGSPSRYSDTGLWPGMYGWHLQAYLEFFKPSQFVIIPLNFLDSNSSDVCEELSERSLSLDLDVCRRWKVQDDNSHDHPPLEEDVPLDAQVDFDEFMAADHERLLDALSASHVHGLTLFGYGGSAGNRRQIDKWLRSNWMHTDAI